MIIYVWKLTHFTVVNNDREETTPFLSQMPPF